SCGGGRHGHEQPGAVEVALARERAATDDGDEGGEPERGADLTKSRLDANAGREASRWERGGGEGCKSGQHQADADPADDHSGQVLAEVVRLVVEPAQEPEA